MKSIALAMDGGSQNGKQRTLRAGRSQNEFSAHPSPSPHSELLARVWSSCVPPPAQAQATRAF